MRKENNTNVPANYVRDTNGTRTSQTGVSERLRPHSRDNTTTQHDTPAGVENGSMGNGDVSNEINIDDNGGNGWGKELREQLKEVNEEQTIKDTNFDVGDWVYGHKGEDVNFFLHRVGERMHELSIEEKAEISSHIYFSSKEGRYALYIQTSGLPQLSASFPARKNSLGFKSYKDLTVHTHGPEVEFDADLQKKTMEFIDAVSTNHAQRSGLITNYYDPYFKQGKVPAGGTEFSRQDFQKPGFLITNQNELKFQNGNKKSVQHRGFGLRRKYDLYQ